MKRIAFLLMFILMCANAYGGILTDSPVGQTLTVVDSTSLETYSTVLEVSGKGRLNRVMFNNDTTHDTFIRLTIDGYIDTLTVGSGEELTAYVTRSTELNTIGTAANYKGSVIAVHDSTWTDLDLDLDFKTHLKIEARSESGGSAHTAVIYTKY